MKKIAICEPHCKGGSHEAFTSSYIYALCILYNDIDFCYFAEETQIEHVKKIFDSNQIFIPSLTYKSINYNDSVSINERHESFNILAKCLENFLIGEDKKSVFFTSIDPTDIKFLNNKDFICVCIIHGFLEALNDAAFLHKLHPLAKFKDAIWKVLHLIHHPTELIQKKGEKELYKRKTTIRVPNKQDCLKMLKESKQSKFSFVFISQHIINNLQKKIPLQKNFYYIPLLELQKKEVKHIKNEYPKFAIFGFGADNNLFTKLALSLEKKNLPHNYELRNIGMRTYPGLNHCSHVNQLNKGYLTRAEMDKAALDVDFFINFYPPYSYKFTCSGSIVEAITKEKPVIYIKNDCYDSYNEPFKFGIKCRNIREFEKKLIKIISNWNSYSNEYQNLLNNLILKKEEISIKNQLGNLKKATSSFFN